MSGGLTCRGIALSLRDEGSISNLQFQNISITTKLYDRSWPGGAEPIYITAMGRYVHSKACHVYLCCINTATGPCNSSQIYINVTCTRVAMTAIYQA